jgi:hypothetical protein
VMRPRPTAAAANVLVCTEFLLADQEETRPCPGVPENSTGSRAGRNSSSEDRTSYPE